MALAAFTGVAVAVPTPASAYLLGKLVGVGDDAFLVYETPAGGFYLELI